MSDPCNNILFRSIPSITKALHSENGKKLQQKYGLGLTTYLLREKIEILRTGISTGEIKKIENLNTILDEVEHEILRISTTLGRRAINATGIILHTGLGRSPLSASAISAISEMNKYSLLEVDIESGQRGIREERVEKLIKEITSAEAATFVNNNAAAIFMALKVIGNGKEVIQSRGQLIEIGGSFRMPDVMRQSGCILKEVGTTNKTRIKDFEEAITENTGALLNVHCSNFKIVGFTESPSIEELSALGKKYNLPVIDDIGSGAFVSLTDFALTDDLLVQNSLKAGVGVVTFSGDKLISGPQCGIICGKKDFIAKIRKDPFFRMFRPDKLTLAALEATLIHFINGDYKKEIPFYKILARNVADLRKDAETLKSALSDSRLITEIADDSSYTGGGALPDQAVPTVVVKISSKSETNQNNWAEEKSKFLRNSFPSIFCRIKDNKLIFDMRTLVEDDLKLLSENLQKLSA
ncbi:MAG: L-seryl-tRNA(Sec) selenium transferase [Proteobacteria bacterium]|nr:L-seryl-tRNA(Sec) selenium transferase [Pseudomonadota bacterium]